MLEKTVTDILHHLPEMQSWMEETYEAFHRHPELSMNEEWTLDTIETHLRTLDCAITRLGGGIIGIIKNGEGPVVMMRADIDALPVTEQTQLPYSSTRTTTDEDGNTVGVMHACGHDVHITSLLGATRLLSDNKNAWKGTYIALFQPGEEIAAGARSMVEAGLAQSVPHPDVVLGQHVLGFEAGAIRISPGPILSASDSIKITLHGAGSHGSMPHLGVDPVVLASSIVMRLQGIVAREIAPGEPAVVTVGAIHAGNRPNVISDQATLRINTRAYSEEILLQLRESIERIVRAECQASNSPQAPEFEYSNRFPLTNNDTEATAKVAAAMRQYFGDKVKDFSPVPASEDFSYLAQPFKAPYVYWGLGGFPTDRDAPGNHSPYFAPVKEPTLAAGASAAVVAALAYFIGDEK